MYVPLPNEILLRRLDHHGTLKLLTDTRHDENFHGGLAIHCASSNGGGSLAQCKGSMP